ncbi:MAG TPA: EAL domain-containing protein [Candidatus Limnocylindrales bacterium]|nr:EAL domain-containing protein [Candidatus Limnocylindrales bacterium]
MPRQRPQPEDLARDLVGAIERGEFRLEFQPVVRLGSGAVAGAEALLRWRHPQRGTISPNEFIPLADQAGLMDEIGAYVLDQACRAAAGWPRTADRPGFVSVNVLPSQLRQPGIGERTLRMLSDAGLEPRLLTIELTSGAGHGHEQMAQVLTELRDAGIRVALDDFGMSTSLADLKLLPIDVVKLAHEFVADVTGPADDSVFATTLINLADSRAVEVVAKGVESREQAWRLAELGCRYGQGFFFSKPLGASGVLAVLRQGSLRG